MAPGADLTAQCPPARMPKLKYRNPLPTTESTPSLESRRDSAHQSPDAEESRSLSSTNSSPSNYTPSIDTASLTSSSLASTAPSVASSDDAQSSKKKKKTGVFGFLSLKEPSKDAFKQYAEAQRKQAAEKGAPSPPSTRGSTSSSFTAKKLPDSVPKVNSKWDGVPEIVKKQQHNKSSASSKKTRHSVRSQSSQSSRCSAETWDSSRVSVLTDGTQNPPTSVATPEPSTGNLDARDGSRSASPRLSISTLPELSYYFPQPLQDTATHSDAQPDVYHPSVFENTPRSSSSTFNLGSPLEGVLPGLRSDSPASSTGSADTVVRDTADAIFKKLNDQPQKSLWGDAPAVQLPDEEARVAVPESHNFLFDDQPSLEDTQPATPPSVPHYAPSRPVQNFSRPMSSHFNTTPPPAIQAPSYRTTPTGPALPTLYETSLASTQSLNMAESIHSVDSDETVQYERDTDTYSIAPSTVAPSVLSAHWHDSPRERLGLGGRLRMNAQTPWESQGEEPGKLKKYRLSMFGKAAPRA
ncbi:hypothetical protein HBI51_204510 [Parastagonospora nodorum]|nr:hypothetical protein HBH75_190270 [Parastagonospora nodorum]KAH5467367.1 hypothetical protein HBI28_201480 [Parastagonospora nodorum]KAH5619778.1 hypothetical protein HBI22_218490 [Parastagonospora nodorum]KAH5629696.1 hypothetical protein HBI51_204510 [Parastagonospora nodorum]